MSVGLFGAYTGSPRLQRAYAAPSCTRDALAIDDTTLRAALDDSSVTCIEIQGSITLAQDLPSIGHSKWNGSAREVNGLTIFGTGDDTIYGSGHFGIQVKLDDNNQPVTSDVRLSVSDLTLSDFSGNYGSAVYAYLWYQPHDLVVDLNGVHIIGGSSTGYGGAAYAGSKTNNSLTSSTYVTVTDSVFEDNAGVIQGGALWVFATDDTATLSTSTSTFSRNDVTHGATGFNEVLARGGAVAVRTDPAGYAKATVGPGSTFDHNTATVTLTGSPSAINRAHGGALYSSGSVDITSSATFESNSVFATASYTTAHGGAVFASGAIAVGSDSTFSHNTATQAPADSNADGGALYTAGSLTVLGDAVQPVVFSDDSASRYGGAIFAHQGGSITSAVFERNTAEWGGAAYSHGSGWTFTESTIADNYASVAAGGIYSGSGSTRLYRTAIVDNVAGGGSPGGILVNGGPLTVENSFISSNSATDTGGGIWTGGDVYLRFSTVYDNSTSQGASEIAARNITSTMSVVGNSNLGTNIWDVGGTLDDTDSVSTATADDSQFATNLTAGTLDFGNLTGSLPGELGRTPNADSPLAVAFGIQDGHAPLVNPLPSITTDQRGFARVAPFTIGARQALTINSVTPSSGESTGGELITIRGSAFTGATTAAIDGAAVTNLNVVDDTTITGIAPAGTVGTADVTVSDDSGTATLPNAFTFVSSNPPSPTPETPASAPRDIRAEAGAESATVSWLPPASTGSFPVTSYQATASPGGTSCLVAAPALTCTITGLTPGTPYTVTAKALTGAGWSQASSPSATVVPLPAPKAPTILITSSRDRTQKSMARVEGTTTGLVGAEVVPYVRVTGQTGFTPGTNTRTVDADGRFEWQRKTKKRFTVYFVSGNVTSNRLVIRPS